MSPLATVHEVRKQFATVTAVDGVSLEVQEGEILALLGPNGAGKSTLIRMMLGLIRPDSGEISYQVDGTPKPTLTRDEVGYLPEERGLYQDVPVLRTLVYFGELRGMARRDAGRAATAWLQRLNLADRAGEPIKALSKGNQQKVQFIGALLHAPRLAILDEPFSGLDPLNQELFLTLLQELASNGTTVLLSAHQMQLVERIASRVLVMNHGRTVLAGTIPELRREWMPGHRLIFRVGGEPDLSFIARHEPHAQASRRATGEVEIVVADGVPIGPILSDAGTHLDVLEVESSPVTLHDMYVRAAGAPPRGGAGAAQTAEMEGAQ